MASIEVKVPDIGDFDEVSVIELLVKPGDTVKAEQSLVTVESDKASMEIPSSQAGVVKELKVKLGDKVKEGSVLVVLESAVLPPDSKPAAAAPPRRCASSRRAAPTPARPLRGREPKHRNPRPRHRRLQGCRRHRAAGQAGRHGQGRAVADHRGVRQGFDGDSVVGRRRGQGTQGQAGRQGQHRGPDRRAGGQRGRRPCRSSRAPAAPSGHRRRLPRQPSAAPPTAALPPHEPGAPTGQLPHASPSVRKFARELGVPLEEVKGTGPKGRITQEDVQAFTKAVMKGEASTKAAAAKRPAGGGEALGLLPWPKVDFAKFGPDRAQGRGAHQEDQRRQPASQLGDDPARHQP